METLRYLYTCSLTGNKYYKFGNVVIEVKSDKVTKEVKP